MSIHKECGEDIRWVQRADEPGRYHPPLDFVGHFNVINEAGELVYTAAYKTHRCDPDKVEAWLAYLERIEKIKERQPDITNGTAYAAAKAKRKEDAWGMALPWSCPTCEAPPGSYCTNMSKRHRGQNVETTNPHPARLELEIHHQAQQGEV